MAALPPFAPWIKPADETANFATGYQMAASAAEHAAALAAQKEEADQKMELAQQVQKQNVLMEQQRMAITKQYHEQQAAINKQKADQAAAMNEYKMKQAMQLQSMRANLGPALTAAKTPEERAAVLFQAGITGASAASMMKQLAPQATVPGPIVQSFGGRDFQQTDKGGWKALAPTKRQPMPEELSDAAFNKDRVVQEQLATLKVLDKDISEAESASARAPFLEQKAELLRKLNERRNLYDRQYGAERATQSPPPPTNRVKTKIVDGRLVVDESQTQTATSPTTQTTPAPAPAPMPAAPPMPSSAPTPVAPPPPSAPPPAAALPTAMVAPTVAAPPAPPLNPNNLTPQLSGAQTSYNPLDSLAALIGRGADKFLNPFAGQDPQAYAIAEEQKKEELRRRALEAAGQDFSD